MNRRACPACAERYPLQHGLHHLPDGNAIRCVFGVSLSVNEKMARWHDRHAASFAGDEDWARNSREFHQRAAKELRARA